MVKSSTQGKSSKTSTSKHKKEKKLEPTYLPWENDRYIARRTNWLWRIRPFVMEHSEQCKTCMYKDVCHRIPSNERIMSEIISTGKCRDYKSVWKKILGKEEKYDWGF